MALNDDTGRRAEPSPGPFPLPDPLPSPGGLIRAFSHGRPALITYAMAGYPDRSRSLAALHVLADNGADLIELGVPYSDPMADGPVIRDAADAARAAAGGVFGLAETISLAEEFLRQRGDEAPPLALMTYLNPLMRTGLPRVAGLLREAGIGGVIVPDLPPEMASAWLRVSDGLDTVFLAAPTSTHERLEKVGSLSRGFLYCVSTTGVTGERSELPHELGDLVEHVRSHTRLPVAVGFGVSTPEQAASVARIADGVVVGSALVRRQGDLGSLADLCRRLAEAVHG